MTATSDHSDRPPRMTDVAELAGVSHQTVSRVVNGAPGIRPETRARVVAAIDRLGYRRNSAAWMLAMSRHSGDAGAVDETQHPSTETDALQAGTVGP